MGLRAHSFLNGQLGFAAAAAAAPAVRTAKVEGRAALQRRPAAARSPEHSVCKGAPGGKPAGW